MGLMKIISSAGGAVKNRILEPEATSNLQPSTFNLERPRISNGDIG